MRWIETTARLIRDDDAGLLSKGTGHQDTRQLAAGSSVAERRRSPSSSISAITRPTMLRSFTLSPANAARCGKRPSATTASTVIGWAMSRP